MEKKAVQAAANAQQVTGAAVQFHPGKNQESPFEVMRVFQEAGGRADKSILCHTESELAIKEMSYLKSFVYDTFYFRNL